MNLQVSYQDFRSSKLILRLIKKYRKKENLQYAIVINTKDRRVN